MKEITLAMDARGVKKRPAITKSGSDSLPLFVRHRLLGLNGGSA
jgi:hypothetical protein